MLLITVNNELLEFHRPLTVTKLVARTKFNPKHAAAEVNGEVIRRAEQDDFALQNGD